MRQVKRELRLDRPAVRRAPQSKAFIRASNHHVRFTRLGVKLVLLCFALFAFTARAGEASLPPDPAETAATASASREAQKWLALIDADQFAQSWTQMAEVFKREATQDQWMQSLTGIREIIGKRIMRVQTSATFSTTVRGAPRGEYVTFMYATQFEKVPPATETLLAAKDADGAWRIAGYAVAKTLAESK